MTNHARQTKGTGPDGQAWGCSWTSTTATSDDIANAGMIGMMGHGAGMMRTVMVASKEDERCRPEGEDIQELRAELG